MNARDQRATLLGEAPVSKALITLAVPSIIGMIVNGIYNVVDTIFVGRLGTSAIGAVSVVFPFFMMIVAVGLAVGMGGASYVSRLLGAGQQEKAERTAVTAIVTVFAISLVFMVMGQFWLVPILRLFGATDTILPYSVAYARTLILGSPFIMVKMTLNNLLRAEGSAKASMLALVAGAVLNIILDPILIFGLNMGILGAAVATVISQGIAVGYQLWYYASGRSLLRLSLARMKPSKDIYSQILKIGTPLFVTQGLNSVAMAMINAAASPYGDAAVASMGVVKRVMALGMFAVFGYAQGFQPVAGFNYGAKKFERLWEAIRFSLIVTTSFTVVATALFIGFAESIISWFSTDPEVLELGTLALRALSAPFALLGFMLVYFSLCQALGKAIPAAVLSVSRQGLVLIPAVLILPRFYGLYGVIYAQPLADVVTLVITVVVAVVITKGLHRECALYASEGEEETIVQAEPQRAGHA